MATKRDIDLLAENKTAGDKKVIWAEALRDLHQLQEDYDKKQQEAAQKRAQQQAEVEKKIGELKAGLLEDESERRIQQLITAAENEKATAKGTAEQIAEQRRLIMEKLAVDVEAERKKQADKQLQSELGVEKLRNSLIKEEFDRKEAEILTDHKEALARLKEEDANYVAQVNALDDVKSKKLSDNDKARVLNHKQILEAIAAVDRGHAIEAAEKDENNEALSLGKRLKAADRKLALDQENLAAERDAQLDNENLAQEQIAGIRRDYDQRDRDLAEATAKFKSELERQAIGEKIEAAGQGLAAIADFEKDHAQQEVTHLEKAKADRLVSLEKEYQSGLISKELYEQQKAQIESGADEQIRKAKRAAAEKEKEYNIAQAIIQTALSILKASPNPFLMAAAAVVGTAQIAKISTTPIPEFEQGGIFSRAWRGTKQAVRSAAHYASGGRINPTAGVADVGQRHSGGGIRMVDGATGEHLGEWERGEAYMILSRETYANNKHLVDELLDTSLHRGGAPVRPRPGYFEDGGTFAPGSTPEAGTSPAQADSRELVQLLRETRDAVRSLPSRQYIGWD